MEDSGTGYQELLVARSYKRCRKIYRRMQFILKNEE